MRGVVTLSFTQYYKILTPLSRVRVMSQASKWKITSARLLNHETTDRLVGLVVKASASRAENPGFESRLRREFSRGRVIPVT